MPKKMLIVEAVKAAVVAHKPTPMNWFERLPPEHREELLEAKRMFKAGETAASCSLFARKLVNACREAGVKTCGPEGMRAWLAKD